MFRICGFSKKKLKKNTDFWPFFSLNSLFAPGPLAFYAERANAIEWLVIGFEAFVSGLLLTRHVGGNKVT